MKKFYTLSLLLPAVLFLMPSALKAQTEAPEVTAAQKELDKMTISKLLGHHWSGRQLPEDGMENIYLVNVKTGEYLVAGDYWGTASMLDHVGLRFSIQPAAGDGRIADHPDNVIEHGSYTGYWIGLHDVNDGRVLGRAANGDGKWGAFENMRYIFAREKKEYINNTDGANAYPGGFIWYFHPVKEDPDGGYIYNIFAFRRSATVGHQSNDRNSEYQGRKSYVYLTSETSDQSDYNVVRFRKFAGKMYNSATTECMGDEKIIVESTTWNSYLNAEHILPLADGLELIKDSTAAQWKIVTYDERKKYRLTASKKTPVDASFNIQNNKFYNAYIYTHQTGQTPKGAADMKWDWEPNNDYPIDNDYKTQYEADKASNANNFHFHKIGVGYYWGYGHGLAAERSNLQRCLEKEPSMTLGMESNLCASIFQGAAGLKQTIKGLRAGKYVVYCRGFYAPDRMEDFAVDDDNNPTYTTEQVAKAQPANRTTSGGSYLFAQTATDGKQMRRLPSIFDGLTSEDDLDDLSKEVFMASDNFQYTQLGGNPTETLYGISNDVRIEALKDKNVFARIKGADLGSPYESDKIYYVPKTVSAAGRFFNATKLEQAQKYRVGVEVQLGDGEDLIIGVEHNSTGAVGEWVCFDEFELVYLGKDFNDEFVIDEDVPLNNTILMDLFQYLTNAELESGDKHVVSKVIIHRTLKKDSWNSIVLPLDLTGAQVKEAFGKDAKVSELEKLEGKTIYYKSVELADNVVAMYAGKPYIIMPSDYPVLPAGAYYQRNYQEKTEGGTTKEFFVIGEQRNEKITSDCQGRVNGPIYMIDKYRINALTVFPGYNQARPAISSSGLIEWQPVQVTQAAKLVQIAGDTSGKKYRIKSKGYYDGGTKAIPANSYYHANNTMYYTSKGVDSAKGFRAYVQLVEEEGGEAKGFFMEPFFNAGYTFVEVDDEVTGITDVEPTAKGSELKVYDLQGRRVANPGRGIYIVDGKKVMFK